MYRASGPSGALGCGLALFFLGIFLLTPVAVILIQGIGWILIVLGLLLASLAGWAWFRQRRP
jgi:hypothetical protein